MINLSPVVRDRWPKYEEPEPTKKFYSRPWYEKNKPPIEILTEQEGNFDDDDFDSNSKFEEVNRLPMGVDNEYPLELPRHKEDSSHLIDHSTFESSTNGPVLLAHGFHYKHAVMITVASASVICTLMIMTMCFVIARYKKNAHTRRDTSPPILVYPPHDFGSDCYMTKEVNFSLPTLRSTSLGELRHAMSMNSFGSDILASFIPSSQCRSSSFANTTELGTLDPALYRAECFQSEDFLWPDGHVGRVWFTLKYECEAERLQVHLIKAKHLPSRTPALANACDPYIRIQLMPDERRVLQTKQKLKTCNPFFDETFVYQVPPIKLDLLTLKLSVVDGGRVGKEKQLIGHITLPLSELDGGAPDEEPQLYKLDIEKELQDPTSDLGEILVSLLYNENLSRLTVTVVEARNVKMDTSTNKREMVVRVTQERACRGVRARRTAAVEVSDDGCASISECFHFRLRPDELHTTSVTIQALQPLTVYGKDHLLGKFVLGSYMFARGRALQHWTSAVSTSMEQMKKWHPLSN